MKGLLAALLLAPALARAGELPLPGFADDSQAPAVSTPAAAAPVIVSTMSAEDALTADTRRHLKALIALDTSNPPGNEIVAADYLKSQLDADGIPSRIYASSGTRASLIARLKGSGAKRPLLLMCHTDVVPADKDGWSTDPFKPTEKDGYLYGRGAADIKCMCAAELSVLSYLKRTAAPLDRDVIFFAEADEESGDKERPIDALVRDHGADLDAEFGINEGGNTVWDGSKVTELRVETAEKQYMDLTLVAHGQAGHASVPRESNAVAAISRAVVRLADFKPVAVDTGVVRGFLEKQEEIAQAPLRTAIDDVLKAQPGPDLERAADNLALASPEFGAMLRDTVVPTMLSAGYKSNVIPAQATAVANVRLLPGENADDFAAALKKAIDDPNVEMRYDAPAREASQPMSIDTDLYRAAQAQMKEQAPQAPVMPFLAAWTTDSQELRAKGVTMYGIDPPLTGDDGERVHGNDERIALGALDWYAKFLRGVVVKTAGAQAVSIPASHVPDPIPAAAAVPAQTPKN